MKQILTFIFVLVLVLGISFQVRAELFNRGVDTLGNRLIYDSDFDITWYDYSNPSGYNVTWQYQMNWASALTVSFGNTIYDDWRLPTALNQDGTGPCLGYNCTGSEMGHLFLTELGNLAFYDASGNEQTGYGLSNKGPFVHLQPSWYWSGTEYVVDIDHAVSFYFGYGAQTPVTMATTLLNGIAVRPGDIAVVPEPISSILFITGGATLIGQRCRQRYGKSLRGGIR